MSVLYYRALGLMKDEDRADKREKWKKPSLALDLLANNTRHALGEFRDLRREVVSLASQLGGLSPELGSLGIELVKLGVQMSGLGLELGGLRAEIGGLSAGFSELCSQLDLLLSQASDIEVKAGNLLPDDGGCVALQG